MTRYHGNSGRAKFRRFFGAIEGVKTLAKSQELGQVVIHRKDGTIQTEYTFQEGKSRGATLDRST